MPIIVADASGAFCHLGHKGANKRTRWNRPATPPQRRSNRPSERYPGKAFDSLDHRPPFEYGTCSGENKGSRPLFKNNALARIAKAVVPFRAVKE